MSLSPHAIGLCSPPVEQGCSTRWLMAYAASVGATSPAYLDTCAPGSVAAHPVFPVCLEWPALQGLRVHQATSGLTDSELARNVHGSLDLHLHRPLAAEETLVSQAEIIGIEPRGAHAWQWVRVDTRDARGELVARSYQGGVFLNVAVDAGQAAGDQPPATPAPDARAAASGGPDAGREIELEVMAGAAHLYSEASRIWNPVHTDLRVALAAGLPGLILHGTATLALAVTRLVQLHLADDPRRVRRVGCRFGAPVQFPSRLSLHVTAVHAQGLSFQVHDAAGQAVLRSGFLAWD